MSDPILVIGALGNVGTEVVKRLQAAGRKVRAADLNVAALQERFDADVESVHFDFSKPETFAATFTGIEKIFLVRPPQIANVQRDMFPALDAAKRAGIKHVVFLSLIGVEKANNIPHRKIEKYLEQLGIQTTFLRCSFFMQNLNTAHRKEIKENNEIFVPVGAGKTSFIDVRDIAAVAAVTLTEEGHTGNRYDLTGAEALDYWQVTKILSETLGKKVKYRNPNPVLFLIRALQRGASLNFALVMFTLYTLTRFGMANIVTNEVERLTGRPPISLKRYTQDYKKSWM
jgi:uncharacterized protein YbjT (DUF2867 family)